MVRFNSHFAFFKIDKIVVRISLEHTVLRPAEIFRLSFMVPKVLVYQAKSLNFSRSVPRPSSLSFSLPLICPGHFKPSRFLALQGDGPEPSTPRSFHYSHIYTLMLDNVSVAFLLYLPTSLSFFLWNIPPTSCLPGADFYYFSTLMNHYNRIKTAACIHHIASATFPTVANNKLLPFCIFNRL
jgi:hypothetical protein